jgi:magnesium transporter
LIQLLHISDNQASVLNAIPKALPRRGFLWFDVDHTDARRWVDAASQLTGAKILEDHLSDAENLQHPSYYDSTLQYEMIVFRGLANRINLDARAENGVGNMGLRIKTKPTTFFILPKILVTVRGLDSKLFTVIKDKMLASADSNQRMPSGPEELMLRFLNGMVDRYLDLRQPMTDLIDRWQKDLLDPRRPFRDWYLLLEARSEIRKLEMLCEEQLDALQEWRDERAQRREVIDAPGGPLNVTLEVRTNDVVEHIGRVMHHSQRLEAAAESAVQLHFSSTAHRTNEIMRTLTAITAIFLPLTLITGIFGMNFDAIPGLHSRYGFWMSIGFMLLVAGAMVVFFMTRRYLASSSFRRMFDERKKGRDEG